MPMQKSTTPAEDFCLQNSLGIREPLVSPQGEYSCGRGYGGITRVIVDDP